MVENSPSILSTCLLGRNAQVNREIKDDDLSIDNSTLASRSTFCEEEKKELFKEIQMKDMALKSSSEHTTHLMLWTYQLWKRNNLKDKARLSMCITRINLMGDAKGHRCCHRQHQHQSESSVPHPNPRSRECCFCHLTILHAKWNILRNY